MAVAGPSSSACFSHSAGSGFLSIRDEVTVPRSARTYYRVWIDAASEKLVAIREFYKQLSWKEVANLYNASKCDSTVRTPSECREHYWFYTEKRSPNGHRKGWSYEDALLLVGEVLRFDSRIDWKRVRCFNVQCPRSTNELKCKWRYLRQQRKLNPRSLFVFLQDTIKVQATDSLIATQTKRDLFLSELTNNISLKTLPSRNSNMIDLMILWHDFMQRWRTTWPRNNYTTARLLYTHIKMHR